MTRLAEALQGSAWWRRLRGEVGEALRNVVLSLLFLLLLLVLLLIVFPGAVGDEDVAGTALGGAVVTAQQWGARGAGLQGAVGAGARLAGGARLVGLLHVELGQAVLPARLSGQLANVLLVIVDKMEELREREG